VSCNVIVIRVLLSEDATQMKNRVFNLVIICIVIVLNQLVAQNGVTTDSFNPFQQNRSVLFGFDTFINSQPQQDQRNVVICSAFNGWLYAVYSYPGSLNQAGATILRSKNNGQSWSVILNSTVGFGPTTITKLNIRACGHDSANLKLFIGYCITNLSNASHIVWLGRYNGNTGSPEAELLNENSESIRDFALATDDLYPASNSNPFSLGVIYTTGGNKDSVIFRSSSNGGLSLDSRHCIAVSSKYFDKVALAYGRSPSCNNGRYYAAWEEKENSGSLSGHIYSAYSEPNFSGPFTVPVQLDGLEASFNNRVSNPVIACQNNGIDNDSSSLTGIVLFNTHLTTSAHKTIAGFYNKKAMTPGKYVKFSITDSLHNSIQPDISFDPNNFAFIVTYFDSTIHKLPYFTNNANMTTPNSWELKSQGYNDDDNLAAPHPKVAYNFGLQSGMVAWIDGAYGELGRAMYDAPYIFYTGVPGKERNCLKLNAYPIPTQDFLFLEFALHDTRNVVISLQNIFGQTRIIENKSFPAGMCKVKIDLSKYNSGSYMIIVQSGDSFSNMKILLAK